MTAIFIILSLILIKTSLLGLGLISLGIAFISLWLLNRTMLTERLASQFRNIFKIALVGHGSVYIILVVKIVFIDGLQAIPAFIAAHVLIHHLLSAVTGAALCFMLIRLYFKDKASKPTQIKSE